MVIVSGHDLGILFVLRRVCYSMMDSDQPNCLVMYIGSEWPVKELDSGAD